MLMHLFSSSYLSWLTWGDIGENSLKKSLICVNELLNLLCGRFNLILGKSWDILNYLFNIMWKYVEEMKFFDNSNLFLKNR